MQQNKPGNSSFLRKPKMKIQFNPSLDYQHEAVNAENCQTNFTVAPLKKEELKPEVMHVVFKNAGFKDDVGKTNTVPLLRQADIEDAKSL